MGRRSSLLHLFLSSILIIILGSCSINSTLKPNKFDGNLAFSIIKDLAKLGPRIPNSQASEKAVDYVGKLLSKNGWRIDFQQFSHSNCSGTNIIASKGFGSNQILLGTHFDSRAFADATTENVHVGVPGVNDGLSGVSVLLELSRILPLNDNFQLSLAFFDCEDQGDINGQRWASGSTYFVMNSNTLPDTVVIIDMIGDKNLNIYKETNSSVTLSDDLWGIASTLGFQKTFINETRYSLLDDHFPFLQAGIPAALIIDFDYPYWHTTEDTIDKVHPNSLQQVGDVLFAWIQKQY